MSTTINRAVDRRKSVRASQRVNLRIAPRVKGMLVQAARLHGVRLTEFMVTASQVAAEAALAERTQFTLSPEKWRAFNAALDAPPRDLPALRRLFSEPSLFRDP